MAATSRPTRHNFIGLQPMLSALGLGFCALVLSGFGRAVHDLPAFDRTHLLILAGYPIVALLLYWAVFHDRSLMINDAPQRLELIEFVIPPVVALSGLGLAFLYRLDPDLARKQLLWNLIGACLLIIAYKNFESLRISRFRYIIGLAAVSLLILTLLLGREMGGARAWIVFGPLHFEPVEAGKSMLVIFLAAYLAETRHYLGAFTPAREIRWRYLGPVFGLWAIFVALLTIQRDLGAAILLYGTGIFMLYIGTGQMLYPLVGVILASLGAVAAAWGFPHIRARFLIWFDPWAYSSGSGYQILHGLAAIAEGGFLGKGLGFGSPGQIPAVHTDFISAAISEELGLVGMAMILLIYATLITGLFRIALSVYHPFRKLLAAGIAVQLALQTLTIAGGVVRLVPVTGVTLPLISYGGSSLTMTMASLGLVLGCVRTGSMGTQSGSDSRELKDRLPLPIEGDAP